MIHSPLLDATRSDFSDDVVASIKQYQRSDLKRSLFQVTTTIGALLTCYVMIYAGVSHGWWAALVLTPLAAGRSIRTFVLQHDCGHGSLFKKQWLNDLKGRICSLLTLTPYDHWRRHHALHHGSWNNMGTRGRISDMYSDCITTSEYKKMKSLRKIFYRNSINTILSILIMPPFIFFIVYRIAFDTPRSWIRERMGVYLTNLCLFLTYSALIWFMGWKNVALVSFLVIYSAAVSGVWLFIVQHEFEGVHRAEHAQWNNLEASVTGCSFLRLLRVLRWFSGDIGTHHVHHAAPGIPNYRLVDCHNAHPVFQKVKILNFRDGMREAQSNVIWDEESRSMIELRQVC